MERPIVYFSERRRNEMLSVRKALTGKMSF